MYHWAGHFEIIACRASCAFAYLRILVFAIILITITGCAIVRDPLPPRSIVFVGWGTIDCEHSKDVSGEYWHLHRDISTVECLAEIGGIVGTIASVAAMCF